MDYVPCLWYSTVKVPGERRPRELGDPDALREYIAGNIERYPAGTIWLVGNEVGFTPGGDSRTPQQYAIDYHGAYHVLKSMGYSYQVGHGAVITTEREEVTRGYVGGCGGIAYLERVLLSYRDIFGESMPIDVFNIHVYARNLEEGCTDLQDVMTQVVTFREFMKDQGYQEFPLMISELGCPLGKASAAEIMRFMTSAYEALLGMRSPQLGMSRDNFRLVQRIAWFIGAPPEDLKYAPVNMNLGQTSLMDRAGSLTALGQTFRQMIPELEKRTSCAD